MPRHWTACPAEAARSSFIHYYMHTYVYVWTWNCQQQNTGRFARVAKLPLARPTIDGLRSEESGDRAFRNFDPASLQSSYNVLTPWLHYCLVGMKRGSRQRISRSADAYTYFMYCAHCTLHGRPQHGLLGRQLGCPASCISRHGIAAR